MKNALIIFIKNPVLGKVKTRLALKIGDEKALAVYNLLLAKTHKESTKISDDIFVYYSDFIESDDMWQGGNIQKKCQNPNPDLGIRMQLAFKEVFEIGYQNVILIGSDIYDIRAEYLQQAFQYLDNEPAILGPSLDGGYYALGFSQTHVKQISKLLNAVFLHKKWSHNAVYQDAINVFDEHKITFEILPKLRDIDNMDDLLSYPELIYGAKISY